MTKPYRPVARFTSQTVDSRAPRRAKPYWSADAQAMNLLSEKTYSALLVFTRQPPTPCSRPSEKHRRTTKNNASRRIKCFSHLILYANCIASVQIQALRSYCQQLGCTSKRNNVRHCSL